MNEHLTAFNAYVDSLQKNLATGNATEHTHRPALKTLLEALDNGLLATNEPKHIECGAPDFILTKGSLKVGYIEAKDVGKSLDEAERSDQLKRYFPSLTNLVLTDYLEFRWYVDGERRLVARIGASAKDGKIKRDKAGVEETAQLLTSFLSQQAQGVGTPKELAQRMAHMARMTRDLITEALKQESESGTLHAQLAAFRDNLIPDLDVPQFADMYAQTIAYGLFAARCASPTGKDFTREKAAYLLPKTNPFLRKLFNHIAGPDLDDRIAWLVDDLAQLLAHADMEAILKDFGKRTAKEDPVVHFYETFLAAYDPRMRQTRGVYYTPEPVVSYIVRSIDHLMKTRFGKPQGLADPSVLILDPAVGTATFLYDVIKLIHESLVEQGQKGLWNDYVPEKLLPRLFGFELLMAPYAVAHLKLGLLLQETGYEFKSDQRLGVYLTNTLEEAIKKSEKLFESWITEEANAAAEIKKVKHIMVVLGNPPYSGVSANASTKLADVKPGEHYMKRIGHRWVRKAAIKYLKVYQPTFIGFLLDDYYFVDGQPLNEKNPKWLQDDYVKFIRFGQWRIESTGQGVLAFITNHGYLDNPTFRGMRQSLMNTFTDIYILDLHGNIKKREHTPDGGSDQNVFDIQQGVAIGVFVKEQGQTGPAHVHHADVWGVRDAKYAVLAETSTASTQWTELMPSTPSYPFVPQMNDLLAEYDGGWKVPDIFHVNSVGIVTARDNLTIGWSRHDVRETVSSFSSLPAEVARTKYALGEDVRDWKVSFAQKDLNDAGLSQDLIVPILYRPFDLRYTYYTGRSRGFICMPRPEVMRHMLAEKNIALISARSNKSPHADHFFCSRFIVETKCGESTTQSYTFPLYLYPTPQEVASGLYPADERRANLNPKFIADVEKRLGLAFTPDGKGDLGKTFGPEDVFHYAYAIFHSPTYRSHYAEFLKTDFPRLPLTSNKALFKALVGKGAELVALHLMESPALQTLITKYPVSGSDVVEKIAYDETAQRVFINKAQYFEGVPPKVWEFHVGGYQVCDKWLKDRKGRKLGYEDLTHYQKVVVALRETIRLMGEVDAAIPRWPLE